MLAFVFTTVFENPTLANALGNATAEVEEVLAFPQFPIWNSTYENSQYILWNFTINGGFFSGGADVDFIAGIPNGWIVYLGDSVIAIGAWIEDIGQLLFYWAIIIFEIITPPDQVADYLTTYFIIPYAIVYIMLGLGIALNFKEIIGVIKPLG